MTGSDEVPAKGRLRRRVAASGAGLARKAARLPDKLPKNVRQEVTGSVTRMAQKAARLPGKLPEEVLQEVAHSVARLARVRSIKGAQKAVVEEMERLFVAVTPLLAAAPLPVTGWGARVAASSSR